jgi:hypothetical protein
MDLRSGGFSEPVEPVTPPSTSAQWRVSPVLTVIKVVAAVVLALVAALSFRTPMNMVVAGIGAATMGFWALRDLLAPVRLAADTEGVTVVAGFAGRRRLPWTLIDRVRVDERERVGLRSRMLEIDAGESLHLLSTYDLNAQVADVVDELLRLRALGRQGSEAPRSPQ